MSAKSPVKPKLGRNSNSANNSLSALSAIGKESSRIGLWGEKAILPVPLLTLDTFFLACQPNTPLMGMDVGTKTIGVAYSDRLWSIATPSHVIERKNWSATCELVMDAMQNRQVSGLILGWPLHMKGDEGPQCQSVRDFAKNLIKVKDIPLTFWDERLSSLAALEAMESTNFSARKKKSRVHASAAAIILQGALDYSHYASKNHDLP